MYGSNYEINPLLIRQPQVAPQAAAPVEAQIPALEKDPLALRGKLTSDYYNNYGMLQAFVKDMASKGVDVTVPDYSQDGGGLPFQLFQKLQAGLLYSANALSGEFKADQTMLPYRAQGKVGVRGDVDQSGLYSQDANNYFSKEESPLVNEANLRLNTPTYTTQDQNAFNATYLQPNIEKIDAMVAQGLMAPEEGEYQKALLQPNVAQKAYQQLIHRGSGRGTNQKDLLNRTELIKQIKSGIITGDQTPLSILRLIPGASGVNYVNTGDKVGIQVQYKSGEPLFIDLSKGGGEGEINAILNRIEGQQNIPNEEVFKLDTRVNIPASNVRSIVDSVKSAVSKIPDGGDVAEVLPTLQQLAGQQKLYTPGNELVIGLDFHSPWFGDDGLIVKYYKTDKNGNIQYNKVYETKINDPERLANFIEANAGEIGKAFGGGFVQEQAPAPTDLKSKADAIKAKYGIK